MRKSEIHLRDPFVMREEGVYYLYGTTDDNTWSGKGTSFLAWRSYDLERFEGPFPVFQYREDFWGKENFWAPEVHRYRDRYWMLASFYNPEITRGTSVLVSDTPLGMFRPLKLDRPHTPIGWSCLDGTFYLDRRGDPWMVYCHEWTQIGNGAIVAQRFSGDMSGLTGDPVELFRAKSAPWVSKRDEFGKQGYVTDGPYLFRDREGSLWMLWSSFNRAGRYAIGLCRSDNGEIDGNWIHEKQPLYDQDGGHGMLFRGTGDQTFLAIHAPNHPAGAERPQFIQVDIRL